MAIKWDYKKIQDLAVKIGMGPFGSSIKVETFVPEGIPIISGQHLHETRLQEEVGYNYISREHAQRLKNSLVLRGDVIFTHAGNITNVSYIPSNSQYELYIVSQRQFYLRCKTSMVLPEFVAYYFKTSEGLHKLTANSSSVGVPSIAQPVSYLRQIEIPLPPLEEQKRIIKILGSFDDKIELNRRMNRTLEDMARAIFKSWFVDFDPVRAKAEGRDPGLPPEIADLFPNSFQPSELGEIPSGWRVGRIGEIANNPRRGVQPIEIPPSTPYIALEHMPRQCIALSEWGIAEGIVSNKFEFKKGEILFGKLRPYFHKVGIAPVNGVCSTDIAVITPKQDYWYGFIVNIVSSTAFVDYTNAGSNGTKMPRTNWHEMARYQTIIPSDQVAKIFTSISEPLYQKIISNIHESHTLAAMRDTLLPRLMSGEDRIDKAICSSVIVG